ncbi:MAG: DNA methyltransferase [Gammaproteobacteria bacterium]
MNEKTETVRRLYVGDNLAVMRGLESESADLIYLDPPFNSKRIYDGNLDPEMGKQSFKDIWTMSDINKDDLWRLRAFAPKAFNLIETLYESHGESWKAYLTFMAVRLDEMHRLLKPAGSIYLHCDWRMNAPLRLLMDVIFGADNFRNEIVWFYNDTPGRPKKDFARKHDTILRYAGGGYVFNAADVQIPVLPESVARYKTVRKLGGREYVGGSATKTPESVWKFPAVKRNSRESTGWATQKPLALLERIIKASSNKGDVVLDPFCGCATACVAAERLGRRWIGIDQHPAVGAIMEKRIKKDTQLAPEWGGVKIIDARKTANLPRRSGVREIDKTDPEVKRAFYDEQNGECKSSKWCLSGGGKINIRLLDYDRIDPGKRGGYYTPENVQLLCGACNSAKGAKTWTQFIGELKERKARKIADDPDVPR